MNETVDPAELINELSVEFDVQTLERHQVGQEKYGAFSFLGKDMFQEAMNEILDMANYARYQYIKLRMLQMFIAADPRVAGLADDEGNITIGAESFKAGGLG
jgi:hypothetical protein